MAFAALLQWRSRRGDGGSDAAVVTRSGADTALPHQSDVEVPLPAPPPPPPTRLAVGAVTACRPGRLSRPVLTAPVSAVPALFATGSERVPARSVSSKPPPGALDSGPLTQAVFRPARTSDGYPHVQNIGPLWVAWNCSRSPVSRPWPRPMVDRCWLRGLVVVGRRWVFPVTTG